MLFVILFCFSRQSHTLNLHGDPQRQLMHRNAGPRRFMRKMLLILAVHLGEIIHRRQEHLNLSPLPRIRDIETGSRHESDEEVQYLDNLLKPTPSRR